MTLTNIAATSIPRFYKTSQECHFYTGPGEKFSFGRINFVAIRKQAYNGSASTSESHLKGSQSRLKVVRAGYKRNQMATSAQSIRFARSVLGEQRHVSAFFHSSHEEYSVLLPFITEGFERGEKAFHIVDPTLRQEHCRRLESAGVDVGAAAQNGQFELRNWADAYLRDGCFDQDKMLALIQEVLDGGVQQGYALTRLVAHMEWALEDRPGCNDLLEYETRLNYLLPRYKDPVI